MADRSSGRSSGGSVAVGLIGAGLGAALVFFASKFLAGRRADEHAPPPRDVPLAPPKPSPPGPPAVEETVEPPAPRAAPPLPPLPTLPPSSLPGPKRDETRLTFTMMQPGLLEIGGPMRFSGPDMRSYSLKEMIARIKAGARFDVTLVATAARPGSAEYARAYLFKSGILDVYDEQGRRWTLGPDSYLVDTADDPDAAQYNVTPGKTVARAVVAGNARGCYGRSAV